MKTAKEILAEKFEESSGKKCDDAILDHLKYAVAAMDEYAQSEVTKAVEFYHEFHSKLEERVDEEDSDVMRIGEFVMNYFNLWK